MKRISYLLSCCCAVALVVIIAAGIHILLSFDSPSAYAQVSCPDKNMSLSGYRSGYVDHVLCPDGSTIEQSERAWGEVLGWNNDDAAKQIAIQVLIDNAVDCQGKALSDADAALTSPDSACMEMSFTCDVKDNGNNGYYCTTDNLYSPNRTRAECWIVCDCEKVWEWMDKEMAVQEKMNQFEFELVNYCALHTPPDCDTGCIDMGSFGGYFVQGLTYTSEYDAAGNITSDPDAAVQTYVYMSGTCDGVRYCVEEEIWP